ncbi:MAG: tetratricopeptide repeat protein [Deltaproteobacteria bacterium]|nr:tetratricopeptide repeat protein [Deltaproteobacteria bacterium]
MGKNTRLLFLGFLLAALFVFANTRVSAQSDDQIARSAFRLGNAHYENGEFIEAAKEFEKAYKYSGKAQLLYNLYLAYRDANLPEKAADALRRYLKESEEVPNREQIEAKLRALERGLEEKKLEEKRKEEQKPAQVPANIVKPEKQAVEPTEVEPIAEEPVVVVPPEEGRTESETGAEEEAEESYIPLISYIMIGAGGGMVIGSLVTAIATSSAQSELEDECPDKICPAGANINDLKSTKDTGETLAVVTDILLFGGIAIAGGGLALLLLAGRGEESSGSPVASGIGCSTTGCNASVKVSF